MNFALLNEGSNCSDTVYSYFLLLLILNKACTNPSLEGGGEELAKIPPALCWFATFI